MSRSHFDGPLPSAPAEFYPDHLTESYVDAEGNLWFTDRARVAQRRLIEYLYPYKKPMRDLPDDFNPQLYEDAPDLNYGFRLTGDQLVEFAIREQLAEPPHPGYRMKPVTCLGRVKEHLRAITDASVYIRVAWSLDPDVWPVAIYSNWTMEYERCVDEDEKDILSILQRRLQVPEGPMWYW
ncbi:hypothetical protein FA95DRAFT_1553585 [Auriscalpium vulgare]|uniref:Uncharacterized protein n=1 Tax=Auriscalpium vulgare TaxID=40419 RepID=A0ACB8S7U9_9AGAM|nr:hypothetical protein FA95DRAFT_1553585 [Auriscalpium vulgare]